MRFLFTILFLSVFANFAQDLTQSIRGTVTDRETLEPLIGAKVMVVNTEPLIGSVTDINGEFRLEKVPVGRQTIRVTYVGYEPYVRQNIDITSRDVVLEVQMIESVNMTEEIEIKANKKGELVNKMATVSARSFSVEESNRFAGSKNDVARMAQNFAGVQGADDSRIAD